MSIWVSFLGLGIDEMTPSEAVEQIRDRWRTRRKSHIFFVNAYCFNVAAANEHYRDSLRAADLVLADGSGMLPASRVLRVPIQHNLNGTDLIPMLCDAAAEEGRSIFLNIAFLARGAGAGHIQRGAAGTAGGHCRRGRPRTTTTCGHGGRTGIGRRSGNGQGAGSRQLRRLVM